MEDRNPYEPPESLQNDSAPTTEANFFGPGRLHIAWLAVFSFNLAWPIMFGWGLTSSHGRFGMLVAIPILLGFGYRICSAHRELGRLLVIGGALVGLSQIYPVLQFVAGLAGMVAGQALGQVSMADEALPTPVSELGGFIVTMTTGALLILASLVVGYAIQRIRRRQWWRKGVS